MTAQNSDSHEPLGQGKCPAQPRRRSADRQGLHSQGRGGPGPRSGCRGRMRVCAERDLPVGDPLPGPPPRQHRGAGDREAPDLASRNLNIRKNVPLLHVLTETAESTGNQQVRRDDCPEGAPGRGQACGGLPTDGPNPALVGLLMSRRGGPATPAALRGRGDRAPRPSPHLASPRPLLPPQMPSALRSKWGSGPQGGNSLKL